jgi:hypothetical protein
MKKKLKKKFWKKKIENFEKNFWIFQKKNLDFFSMLKGPKSGKEKNRKSGIRTFQDLPDFRTGRDVRLSPTNLSLVAQIEWKKHPYVFFLLSVQK